MSSAKRVAPPRSRRGVFANQVAIYVNGIAKKTFFLAFSFALRLFKRAEITEGLAKKNDFMHFYPMK